MTFAPRRIRVWDLPTRMFHWALAVLVVFSFVTGRVGGQWMAWHLRSGYAILTLLAFRLAWGFVGSETARFAQFVRGPRAAIAYARAAFGGHPPAFTGHNPLGAWAIVLMLAALAVQAATGLFSNDEIATEGPLAVKVSNATVSRMSAVHSYNEWVVAALVLVHVAAIAWYRWKWHARLVGPMLHGWSEALPGMPEPVGRPAALAVALILACATAVYWLVAVYPR